MTDLVHLKLHGPIAELILNNAKRLNALNLEMWEAIPGLFEQIAKAPHIRAAIMHGGEIGHFAAGADISEFAPVWATPKGADRAAKALYAATTAIETCTRPVIAAIEGSCMGAGLSLASACDLRVVADGARFSLPPAKLGAAYPYEDLRRLADIIGLAPTRDLLLTARMIEADEAGDLGLASRRVAQGAAYQTALEIANTMTGLSPWALTTGKAMLSAIGRGQRTETPEARAKQIEGFLGPDFFEGQSAFLEKRKADFS